MSISITAYPLAFLLYPEKSKNIELKKKGEHETTSLPADSKNELKFIKVRTNLSYSELKRILQKLPGQLVGFNKYEYENGLRIKWETSDYCYANISGEGNFQSKGEELFKEINIAAGKNVRLFNSCEYFYYNYETQYKTSNEIIENLKINGENDYYYDSEGKLCTCVNNQNMKYYKPENEDNFYLEIEQKISFVNIGIEDDLKDNPDIISSKIKEIRVKTNIKKDELKNLLKKSGYIYYEGNGQTPLGSGATTLNWIQDGDYSCAIFYGANQKAITADMSKLFQKLNVSAGRDVRKIEDEKLNITYTYSTNYTDKGVLYNVLVEHGAQNIEENGDNISCKLYDMDMVYLKDIQTQGYILEITQVSNITECESTIKDLNEEYGLSMQEITYQKIKERLEKENLRLESEEVLDDNSIVLTIEV